MFFQPNAPATTDPLQQGDIVKGIPFALFSLGQAVVLKRSPATGDTSSSQIDLSDTQPDGVELISPFQLKLGIIATQTCDLARGDRPVTLLPIDLWSEIHKDMKIGSDAFHRRIDSGSNSGRSPTVFTMPPLSEDVSYSQVNLLWTMTFPPADHPKLQRMRIGRLGPEGLGLFQERLSFMYGRFAATDEIFTAAADRKAR